MGLMEGFTRQEVIGVTGLSSESLAYFDRLGIVKPTRFGSAKKPTCIYSWEQLLELMAINNLRKKVSSKTIKKIVKSLEQMGISETLRDKYLVIVGEDVFWVEDNWKDFPEKMLNVTSKKNTANYMFAFMVTMDDLIHKTWENAKKSNKIDFDSFKQRAKAKSMKVA